MNVTVISVDKCKKPYTRKYNAALRSSSCGELLRYIRTTPYERSHGEEKESHHYFVAALCEVNIRVSVFCLFRCLMYVN